MAAAIINWDLKSGTTGKWDVTFYDSTNTLLNLTGAVVSFEGHLNANDAAGSLLAKSSTLGTFPITDVGNALARLTINPVDIAALAKRATIFYTIFVQEVSGDITPVIAGVITII